MSTYDDTPPRMDPRAELAGAGTVKTPEPLPIPAQMDVLGKAVTTLNDKISSLRNRLAPIMSPMPDSEGAKSAGREPVSGPLCEGIVDFANRLHCQITEVEETITRLEL